MKLVINVLLRFGTAVVQLQTRPPLDRQKLHLPITHDRPQRRRERLLLGLLAEDVGGVYKVEPFVRDGELLADAVDDEDQVGHFVTGRLSGISVVFLQYTERMRARSRQTKPLGKKSCA